MNTNASNMTVTGTKSSLRKLAAKVGVEVSENARTGALVVVFPYANAALCNSADARSDGSVAYRLVDGSNHTAPTLAAFVAKCRGYVPQLQNNVQRHVCIQNGVICQIGA